MIKNTFHVGVAGIAFFAATAAFAAPPAGVPVGPPAGIPNGPPAGVPHGPPTSLPVSPPVSVPSPHASIGVDASANASAHGANAAADVHGGTNDSTLANGASYLKSLNAAHASATALQHASSKSIVGKLAIYKQAVVQGNANVTKYTSLVATDQTAVADAQKAVDSAQAKLDTLNAATPPDTTAIAQAQADLNAAKATLATAQQTLAADQASLAAAQQSILDAQSTLAATTNVNLTPAAVARLNTLLGI